MVNFNTLKNSNFLTKEEVTPDVLVTISSVTEKNVAPDNKPAEMKYTIGFHELEKPLVLNFVNASMIAHVSGQDDTDNWVGTKIVLYNDPTIMFQGNMVGGIRVRQPQQQQQAPAQPPQQQNPPRTDETGPLPEPPPY
jgi:hypothetical protein